MSRWVNEWVGAWDVYLEEIGSVLLADLEEGLEEGQEGRRRGGGGGRETSGVCL